MSRFAGYDALAAKYVNEPDAIVRDELRNVLRDGGKSAWTALVDLLEDRMKAGESLPTTKETK